MFGKLCRINDAETQHYKSIDAALTNTRGVEEQTEQKGRNQRCFLRKPKCRAATQLISHISHQKALVILTTVRYIGSSDVSAAFTLYCIRSSCQVKQCLGSHLE